MATDTSFFKKVYLFCLAISCALGISICINVYLFHAFPLPLSTKKIEIVLNNTETADRKPSHPFQDEKCQHFAVQVCNDKTSWNTNPFGLIKINAQQVAETGRNRPKWSLTSFPGSDETWARELIEGATGIYTTPILNQTVYNSLGIITQLKLYVKVI